MAELDVSQRNGNSKVLDENNDSLFEKRKLFKREPRHRLIFDFMFYNNYYVI